ASGSRPADGRLNGRIATVTNAGRIDTSGKAASLLVERRIFLQLECAEAKFLAGIRCCCRLNERKGRIRELLPDRKVFCRNRQPTECEHVSARFGHVSCFLPSDLIDHRSVFPSDACRRYHAAAWEFQASCRPRTVLHSFASRLRYAANAFRRRQAAKQTPPAPASDYPILQCAPHPGGPWWGSSPCGSV